MILREEAREQYFLSYAEEGELCLFSHGRLEIVGNHTDHNRGVVLCSGVDMGITAVIAENDDEYVSVSSKGYKPFDVELSELDVNKREYGTSQALVRGVLFKLKEMGYNIGGFNMACVSDIYEGAGVSSSAAFEALIVKAVSVLFNNDSIAPDVMAHVSQFAENVYFGKPCGLLDQIGACFGGVVYVDFKEDLPEVEILSFPFAMRIFLINAGGSHANLTSLYAEIPADMHAVARHMYGKECLREISREEFFARIGRPYTSLSERAKMRALHFYEENLRVRNARNAIKHHDEAAFIDAINSSGESSRMYLANTMVPGVYEGSPQQVVDTLRPYVGPVGGAIRMMGGGFAGSVIALLPEEKADAFVDAAKRIYGQSRVREVKIFDEGPVVVKKKRK